MAEPAPEASAAAAPETNTPLAAAEDAAAADGKPAVHEAARPTEGVDDDNDDDDDDDDADDAGQLAMLRRECSRK